MIGVEKSCSAYGASAVEVEKVVVTRDEKSYNATWGKQNCRGRLDVWFRTNGVFAAVLEDGL